MQRSQLTDALTLLGATMERRKQAATIVVIGGGALLLSGISLRVTQDLDVLAVVHGDYLRTAQPLPRELAEAAADVASALRLRADWLNPGPTGLLDFGLPDGFLARCWSLNFGPLTVLVAGRFDLLCFKLYAAVDQGGRGKHLDDLLLLRPSVDELRDAAEWTRMQDPSDGFAEMMSRTITQLGVSDAD